MSDDVANITVQVRNTTRRATRNTRRTSTRSSLADIAGETAERFSISDRTLSVKPRRFSLGPMLPAGSRRKVERTLTTPWYEERMWRARVPAEDAAEMLQEGDLLLFSGTQLPERCLQCGLKTEYHHTSIIVLLDNVLQVVESNVEGVTQWPAEAYFDFVNWKFMQDRFGTVAIRRLLIDSKAGNLGTARKLKLRQFCTEMMGHKYARPDKMILAYLHMAAERKDDLSRVYCSEFVAAAYAPPPPAHHPTPWEPPSHPAGPHPPPHRYKAIGLLPEARVAADYLPSDFAREQNRGRHKRLQLQSGAALTAKIVVLFQNTVPPPPSLPLTRKGPTPTGPPHGPRRRGSPAAHRPTRAVV
jgi:hypothetical protein